MEKKPNLFVPDLNGTNPVKTNETIFVFVFLSLLRPMPCFEANASNCDFVKYIRDNALDVGLYSNYTLLAMFFFWVREVEIWEKRTNSKKTSSEWGRFGHFLPSRSSTRSSVERLTRFIREWKRTVVVTWFGWSSIASNTWNGTLTVRTMALREPIALTSAILIY